VQVKQSGARAGYSGDAIHGNRGGNGLSTTKGDLTYGMNLEFLDEFHMITGSKHSLVVGSVPVYVLRRLMLLRS
jgi:hypothetical protein